MADQAMVRYEAEIVGHRAPFKWRLYRIAPAVARYMVQGNAAAGESDSYAEAVSDATEAAEIAHDAWLHLTTKEVETVYEGSPKPPAQLAAEEADRQFEQWASREFGDLLVAEPDRPVRPESLPSDPDAPDPADFAD